MHGKQVPRLMKHISNLVYKVFEIFVKFQGFCEK